MEKENETDAERKKTRRNGRTEMCDMKQRKKDE